jgi:hypothetical protein
MIDMEYGDIEESAMAATQVADCPYKPGTMEWREWHKIFLIEQVSNQESIKDSLARVVTTLPDLEYDDPALAVLNVPEPARQRIIASDLWSWEYRDFYYSCSSINSEMFKLLFFNQHHSPWPEDRKITDLVVP